VRRAYVTAAALTALAGACNPSDFDAAVARAPVRSVKAPDGFSSPDIGRVAVGMPPPRPGSARLFAAGTQRGSLAIFDFDAAGKPTGHNLADPSVRELLTDANAPAGSATLLGNGSVLIGTPTFGLTPANAPPGRTVLLQVQTGTDGSITSQMTKHLEPTFERRRFGLAVATGHVTGPDFEDHLILSEDALAVVPRGDTNRAALLSTACEIALESLPTPYSFRALAAGDLLATGDGQAIAVGVPHDGRTGAVALFVAAKDQLRCETTLKPASTPSERHARFGASVATGDLDGDGKRNELVVGSADDRVYVYRGPFMPGETPDPILTLTPPGALPGAPIGEFGLRVALIDLDGMGGPEIVVAAPSMSVDGKAGAGQVFVFDRQGGLRATLSDHDPDENGGFGLSLTDVRFSANACAGRSATEQHLLAVGGDKQLFVFFALPNIGQDLRCFDKM
jgi:hypothetical protein